MTRPRRRELDRRRLLRAGALGLGAGLLPRVRLRPPAHPERILLVIELTGGNDGLNTVVPWRNDDYYRARPKLAIPAEQVRKLDDEVGLHPDCGGLEKLWHDGLLAIVQGCGYPDSSKSHFAGMDSWHTAVPHGQEELGWLGRFADAFWETPVEGRVVNVAPRLSRAVRSARHVPIAFKDPRRFGRMGDEAEQRVFETFGRRAPDAGAEPGPLAHLDDVAATIHESADLIRRVREACAAYATPVLYGNETEIAVDLKRAVAMIDAGFPTRVFHLSQRGYDTHTVQANAHKLVLHQLCNALMGLFVDLERLGRADDVAVLVFSEFGRRVAENGGQGTDHGTAGPMLVLGTGVRAGLHGRHSDLSELVEGDPHFTTDFRRVYASVLEEWMGFAGAREVLRGDFAPLGLFA